MTYAVEVDWCPTYELIASYAAFTRGSSHKALDLGTDWAKSALDRLPAEAMPYLDPKATKPRLPLFQLIAACPGDRSPATFLDWFERLTYDELSGILKFEDEQLMAVRDEHARGLRYWYEHYFQTVDQGLLDALATAATRIRDCDLPAEEKVEHWTRGFVVADEAVERVVLIPQYHMSPLNLIEHCPTVRYFALAVDLADEDPPVTLGRLTRALSDPSRLRILRFLREDQASFTDVVQFTGLAKSTVHHHLVTLRGAGLLRVYDANGAQPRYTLRPDTAKLVAQHLAQYLNLEEQ